MNLFMNRFQRVYRATQPNVIEETEAVNRHWVRRADPGKAIRHFMPPWLRWPPFSVLGAQASQLGVADRHIG